MSNMQKLMSAKCKSKQIFGNTINDFKNSQGFYTRLYRGINEMEKEPFMELCKQITKQKFTSSLDVIFWLEC